MSQFLYSVYAWPNTVLSVAGGLLIDEYVGLRRGMLLFTTLVLVGSVLFYIGVRASVYWIILLGRIVFGLGGESLSVAKSAFVARWFKGHRGMALAFGIIISFSRVGSSFNFLLAPTIANKWGVNAAAFSGVAASFISVCACSVVVMADLYAERTCYIPVLTEDAHHTAAEVETLRFLDLLRMPLAYWLLCTVCVFCYTAIFPFVTVGKSFLEVKYGYTGDTPARYLSFYEITSALSSPVIGLTVDSVGRNTWWLILACVCFATIHGLFMVTMIPGAVLVVLMGCFYSFLVSGLWPSVTWVVTGTVVGAAYGAITSIQNIRLALFPILVGAILDNFPQNSRDTAELAQGLPPLVAYIWTEALFLLSALLALLASVVLLLEDRRTGGVLSASSGRRLQIVEELSWRENDSTGIVPNLEGAVYD